MGDLKGKTLDGRYELLELIGEGGMADVYKGYDAKEGRVVAVKVLKDEYRENPELVRRFKNEGRAVGVLNHPNIVKVYDVSVDDRLHYIVMEYMDGITLKEYIEQRGEPLTYRETILFMTQTLQALHHAHSKGIVHRDIKPQNLMLVDDGTVKVMDFGIARLARSEIHTAGEQAIGSVHYISPEQAQGADTDPRADIYSLGIMMYEMLTGKLPFESDNAVSIAIAQISSEAPAVRDVNPSVPEGLAEIVAKAMAKDPRYRYQGALDMLRDIEEFKKNPSVKFEYDYLPGSAPAKYVEKVMANGKKPAAANGRPAAAGSTAGKGKNGRKKKKVGLLVPIVAGITLTVVAICFFYCWNLFQNSGNPLFGEYEDIELPDFVGMHYDEVLALTRKEPYNHLRLKPTEEYNPDYAAGVIISQTPTSSNQHKKMVKANQMLYLTVSRGVESVTIPDVSGMTRTEAVQAILDLGLRPYARNVRNDSVPPGIAYGTQPGAGETILNTPGQNVVTILISGESRNFEIQIPEVIGLASKEDAQNVLSGYSLQLGVVKEEYSDAPAGEVIDQTPKAGEIRTIGTSVHVVVSMGPEPPPPPVTVGVPDVTGQQESAAVAALTNAGFVPSVVYQYSTTVAKGVVISGGGGEALPGSTITILVSQGPDPASATAPVTPPPASSSDTPVTPPPDPAATTP